jgi:phosphatidylglycerophosphate synthase
MTENDTDATGPLDRIQQNILAKGERRLLNWICPRLPLWVTPDRLTGFGVFGALVVFAGYALSDWSRQWLWVAILGYVFQWFGDSLDGSLARWRKIERPKYGYFIDHSVDGLVILLIMSGMGMSNYVRMDAALFATVGYLLLSIHAYLAARVLAEFKLSYFNFGPTELRFLLIGLTLAMMVLGPDAGRTDPRTTGFDWFIGVAAAVLNALFIWQTLVTARRLDLMERAKD